MAGLSQSSLLLQGENRNCLDFCLTSCALYIIHITFYKASILPLISAAERSALCAGETWINSTKCKMTRQRAYYGKLQCVVG